MTGALAVVALAASAPTSPAMAVGLGPLSKTGITDGPDKAFYLTLYNPYKELASFTIYAVGAQDEVTPGRVRVPAAPLPLRAQRSRKFTIVAGGLVAGETFTFRICAEKVLTEEQPIHARVCSRITAHRIGDRA